MASHEVSTRFPFINLEKAIARAEALYNGDRLGKPMPIATAFELWGYSSKSSGGFQTISALKMYGLLEDEGANDDRRVRIAAAAKRFFLDERDYERASMLKDFALNPALFSTLWHRDGWSAGLPADTVARSHLKINRSLNDQSARSLLSVFKDNIKYAGLQTGSRNEASVGASENHEYDGIPSISGKGQADGNMEIPNARDRSLSPDKINTVISPKPIIFDMKTVSGQYSFDNADDLADFIANLEKIKPLMPAKD